MDFGAYVCRCTHPLVLFGSSIHRPHSPSVPYPMLVCNHSAKSPSGSLMSTAHPYKCELPMAFGLILCWSLIERRHDVAFIGGLYPNALTLRIKSSRLRLVTMSTSFSFHLWLPAFSSSFNVNRNFTPFSNEIHLHGLIFQQDCCRLKLLIFLYLLVHLAFSNIFSLFLDK